MGYHVIHKRRTRRSRGRFRVDNTGPGRHPVRMSEEDRKRLGDAVRDRRGQLRLTQKDFGARAELSPKQINRIEKGEVEPRAATLGGLDAAGEWPPGTAQSILDGTATAPSEATEPEPVRDEDAELREMAQSIEQVARELMRRLDERDRSRGTKGA